MSALDRARMLSQRLCAAGGIAFLATAASAGAAHERTPAVRTSIYAYDGVVYDRLFSAQRRPATLDRRRTASPGTLYSIIDIEQIYNKDLDPSNALTGFPTAINSSGKIAYYDDCFCFQGRYSPYNEGLIVDAAGSAVVELSNFGGPASLDYTIPYALNDAGYSGGQYGYEPGFRTGNMVWNPGGGYIDFGVHFGSVVLALNNAEVSVGQDITPAKKSAVAYIYSPQPSGSTLRRVLLAPPIKTAWIGTATGINDAGRIVGYATFAGGGRAVEFFQTRSAVVLPVAAAGVSSSAQAINVHGDIVGNAGSQAFLYKNNRVTYLPRPPGETAGNAVAYAINSSDAVVGDIITNTGQTAFLYVNGKSYDLTSLLPSNSGWTITHAAGINNGGEIVGTGVDASYKSGGSFAMLPPLPAAVRPSIVP